MFYYYSVQIVAKFCSFHSMRSCVCVLVLGMLPKNANETDAESDENIPVVEYTDESDYDSSETSEDESDPINR